MPDSLPQYSIAQARDRLFSQKGSFGQSITDFRRRLNIENIDLDPDEVFQGVRDRSPGRDFQFDG